MTFDAQTTLDAAQSSIAAIYRNTGPDVEDVDDRHDFATAALAHTQLAIAVALLEVADALRQRAS